MGFVNHFRNPDILPASAGINSSLEFHQNQQETQSARSVESKNRLGGMGNDIMEHGEAATYPAVGPGH